MLSLLRLFVKEAAINLWAEVYTRSEQTKGGNWQIQQPHLHPPIEKWSALFLNLALAVTVIKPWLKKFRIPLLQWSFSQLPVTWNNTNVVEPAWMLQDDIPRDDPGCSGSAAPHSSDSWPWRLQGDTNPHPGLCAGLTAPIWTRNQRSFQEWPALTKATPLWRKSWAVPAGVSGACTHKHTCLSSRSQWRRMPS